jgi:hypothetical protein
MLARSTSPAAASATSSPNALPPPADVPRWGQVADLLGSIGMCGARLVRHEDEGAYSPALRVVVELADGTSAFVKSMFADCADQLAVEHRVYGAQLGSFHPALHAWLPAGPAGEPAVLVIEDLSDATWGAPLAKADADALAAVLAEVARAAPPAELRPLTDGPSLAPLWERCAADPRLLADIGIADGEWCSRNLPVLAEAADAAPVRGSGLVHADLWLQNWCRRDGRALLVDWSGACIANADFNLAWGECGVRAAGGPPGRVLQPDHPFHASWAALMAALSLKFLLDGHRVRADRPRLYETQSREAIAGLRWACDALDLPPPPLAPGFQPTDGWRP